MNQHKRTTQYSRAAARIALIVIALMLSFDVATAAHAHSADNYSDVHVQHALTSQQCTLEDSSALEASPAPATDFAIPTGLRVAFLAYPELETPVVYEASTYSVAKLRALLQVYLN